MIPDAKIDEIRERTDIVRVVGDHVELKHKGQNWFGLCPFHPEKTPSFSVHKEKQIFHCFGCHETGDVFGFLMKIEGRPFVEVARDLARRAGVDIPEGGTPEDARKARLRRTERERSLELNALVAKQYRQILASEAGRPGREYLRQRGISDETAETFQLGYAPQSWDTLVDALTRKGEPLPSAEKLGLIGQRRGGSGYYDRFRGRLIFPLIGPAGEILGFGGRTIADGGDEPKYINTPETPVYRKGHALYGLHAARQAIRREGSAVLVEGNIDVLSLHQAGHANTVAPMGTALTEQQVRLLRRFTSRVVVLFDGDGAGRQAALGTVTRFLAEEVDARIASVPEGEDPDSLARRGSDAVADCIKGAVPAVDYALASLMEDSDRTIPGRVRILNEAAPLLTAIRNPSARDLYAGKLAAELDLEVGHVHRALRGAAPSPGQIQSKQAPASLPPAEAQLLSLLADHPSLAPVATEAGVLGLIENDDVRRLLGRMLETAQQGRLDVAAIIEEAADEIRESAAKELLSSSFSDCAEPERALRECVAGLSGRSLERQATALRNESKRAEEAGDRAKARELALQAVEMDRQRRAVAGAGAKPKASKPAQRVVDQWNVR